MLLNFDIYIYNIIFIMQMDNLDPSLKTLFSDIGLSQDQLQDKETATFIYDFIEQHGGVEALKREQTVRAPMPPPMSKLLS